MMTSNPAFDLQTVTGWIKPPPVYLEDHPPARDQYRKIRRSDTVTAIVVHTAENTLDVIAPDTGAERVARFISTRLDAAGSYHTIVDSDSTVRLGRYDWEMFHEGTGGNRWSLGLAFACRATDWPAPGEPRNPQLEQMLVNAAHEANRMRQWVKTTHGLDIAATWITAGEYRSRALGFTGHTDLDPGRRSDPGSNFPWTRWLQMVDDLADTDPGEPLMPPPIADWQSLLVSYGYDLGASGANGDGVDDVFGPRTLAVSVEVLHKAKTAEIALDDAALGALTRETLDLYHRQQAVD